MTISQTGNSLGGVISANGTPVANVTSAQGFPFCKNKLFNGEVTRINQRGFDGNWATKNTWASGNTIEQQELCYGYDMWAKASATDMVQPIEAGNFRPSTVHTISGLNMTTRQETSPASGNWNIVVPQAARNVQVEEGSVATPFEIRPISFELAECQRYYERIVGYLNGGAFSSGNIMFSGKFSVTKRAAPAMFSVHPGGWVGNGGNGDMGTILFRPTFVDGFGGDSTTFSGTIAQGQVVEIRYPDYRASAVI